MKKAYVIFNFYIILIIINFSYATANGQSAEIIRDRYWVPHIIGDTPKDCAFGLSIAMCQDHPKVMVDKILNIRGELSRFYGKEFLEADFLGRAFNQLKKAKEALPAIPSDVRSYMDGFAAGINYYFNNSENSGKLPQEVSKEDFLPVSSADVSAAFSLLLLSHEFFQFKEDASDYLSGSNFLPQGYSGMSNQWVLKPERTADDATYLLCDPHLPFTGLTASYEAHLISTDGTLDFEGVFFEATMFPAMGHNRTMAWSHTSNKPDFADAFIVSIDQNNSNNYLLDGNSKPFNIREEIFQIAGENPDTIMVRQSDDHGIEFHQINSQQSLFAKLQIEKQAPPMVQGFRMFTSKSVAEFRAALELHQYDKWNTIVVDNSYDIYYAYNGRVYERNDALAAWQGPLDGSTSSTLWGNFIPFNQLPSVFDPHSDFLQNCNDSPWYVTDNPGYGRQDVKLEIHKGDILGERGKRVLELFEAGGNSMDIDYLKKITLDSKITSRDSIAPVLELAITEAESDSYQHIEKAKALADAILKWDGFAHKDSAQPSLFYTWKKFTDSKIKFLNPDSINYNQRRSILESLIDANNYLVNNFDSVNVPWGEIHRIERNGNSYPLSGGTQSGDEMIASRLGKGFAFDSQGRMDVGGGNLMIYLIRLKGNESPQVWTMKPFGQVTDTNSENYETHSVDMTELYSADSLRKTWYEESEFRANAELTETHNYVVSVDNDNDALPNEPRLSTWPNPFNSTMTISYYLPGNSLHEIELNIYDALGRSVQQIRREKLKPGNHKLSWTPSYELASGIYFIQLKSKSSFAIHRKIVLLK